MDLSEGRATELKRHWNFEGDLVFHRRVANFVYRTKLSGQPVILRLTEPSHRAQAEIESELDWINYLYQSGMRVARPIASNDGALVVPLAEEPQLFAVVFEQARGAAPLDEQVSDLLIESWGEFLGEMHRLTKTYRPAPVIVRRQSWRADETLAMALRSHDIHDPGPYRRLQDLLEWMEKLPQDMDSYGLAHCDLHLGNFFVDQNQITAFDFDDSCYQWFAYDLAVALDSLFRNCYLPRGETDRSIGNDLFLRGYNKANRLEKIWLDRIPVFEQYRSAVVYHWAKTCVKENVFGPKQMEWARERLPALKNELSLPLQLF